MASAHDKLNLIEWVEPFGPNNEPVFCRVTVETAIATQKFSASKAKLGFEYETDEEALHDFMTVHLAMFV